MSLFELYLWIAGIAGAIAATALAVSLVLRAVVRRRLRRLMRTLVLDLSPFIPAGALRQRPPAN